MATNQMLATKESLVAEVNQRMADGIIEEANAKLLVKLIDNADDMNEAINIAALGTTYKRTGFHFDKRLERMSSTIKYFKKDQELSFSLDDGKPINKLIIGDNYDALQNLLIQYRGSIDVIYIDPPYGKDSMGEFAKTNYNNSLTRDNLISMLYNRLILARELLTEDGVIFCSIDDRNFAPLKSLFDEIFNESNCITTFHWEKTQHFGRQKINFYSNCEYVLCYSKNLRDGQIKELLVEKVNSSLTDAPLYNASNNVKELEFPANSVRFNISDGVYEQADNDDYILLEPVEVENGVNKNNLKLKFKSRWSQETIDEEYKKGTTFWVKSTKFAIRTIYREDKTSNIAPKSLIFTNSNNPLVANSRFDEKVGTNENASAEIDAIMGVKAFDYSKPVSLIKYLISLYYDERLGLHRDNIKVLDFFAGSGTTGQAVMELNTDGGEREFILVQLNEDLDAALSLNPDNESIKNQISLCDSIARSHKLAEITAERLRRVMTGKTYNGEENFKWLGDNSKLGGSLDVYVITEIQSTNNANNNTPFDVIDETLYGHEKFVNLKDKIKWVCENFEHTQKYEEDDNATRS